MGNKTKESERLSAVSILDTARWYDAIFTGVLSGVRQLATKMTPTVEGMRILDIGCGTGMQLANYHDSGGELFGIDLSSQMLKVAKYNLKGNIGLVNGDALWLPYANATFDLVISSLFLHQLNADNRLIALDEIMRVVQPAGRVLLIDFHSATNHTIMGKLTYIAISTLELFAGKEHYHNSRNFLSQGGVPNLVIEGDFEIMKSLVLGNGNLGIYLLRSS